MGVTQGTVAPVAANDTAVANVNTVLVIPVLANDTATAPLVIDQTTVAVTTPTGGTATVRADGAIIYTAPATAGLYTFTYTVKDTHVPPQTSNVATVTVNVSSTTLTATLTDLQGSPQLPGKQITFTAAAAGGSGSYEYDFWLFNGTAWSVVQPYSKTTTWVWNTTGFTPGNYVIATHARNAGTTSFADATVFLPYTLTTPASSVILTPNIPSPQLPGPTVTFGAAAAGGSGTYEYRFLIFNGTAWTLVQNYSASPTFAWNTTGLPAGNYLVDVDVRNIGSPADREANFYLSYTLTTPVTGLSVISDVPTPHLHGTPVSFAATGSGGSGNYEYEFDFFNGTSWVQVQPYSGTSIWTMPGTIAAGSYTIGVNVRNAGSSNGSDKVVFLPYVVQ